MSQRAKLIIGIIGVLVLLGGSFFVWNKWTGRFKLGADAILGCQRASDINAFFGAPGANLTSYNFFGRTVTVNRKMTIFLDQIQREVNTANTGYVFNRIDSYNDRTKILGGGKSLHSWGIALDINPAANPYQPGRWDDVKTDIPPKIIEIFKKYGFAWGGDWPGERDPMHFEWYGAAFHGRIIDAKTGQKILDAALQIDQNNVPTSDGDYEWLTGAKTHDVLAKARGYEDAQFKIELFCFQNRALDIAFEPLSENLAGRILGKISVIDGSTLLIPATIYLDGAKAGVSNIAGDYIITGVRRGAHTVTAKIGLFPGTTITTPNMVPGEDLKNLNIIIGR